MNPITLPTSPETRAALEKAGWNYMRAHISGAEQWLCVDGETWVHVHPSGRLTGAEDVQRMMQFAAVLGIHPEGHRIVATKTLLRAHQICDMHVNLAQVVAKVDVSCLVKDTKTALAVALGVAPLPPQPQPSEEGGPSPSPLALLESLYNCAVNNAKVEPELERQIRQAIGADSGAEPNVVGHPPEGVPPRCPITDLPFFCMENLDGKRVPTYGGPFDTYTIPALDEESDSGYSWQRYDQDAGGWADAWEHVPESLIKGAGAPTTKEE